MPLLTEEEGSEEAAIAAAQAALATFATQYDAARLKGLRRKLGLQMEHAGDEALGEDLLVRMAAGRMDFTSTFRGLCAAAEGDVQPLIALGDWVARWQQRLQEEVTSVELRAAAMRAANPIYLPRNHLVAAVIDAAVERQDFVPFEELLAVTSEPFVERLGLVRFAASAAAHAEVSQTFCGT